MPFRRLVLVLAMLFAATPADAQFNVPDPAPGENFHVELGLIFWQPDPKIAIQTGSLPIDGSTNVDFVQALAIEPDLFREFRAVVKAGRKHKLRFSRINMGYERETLLRASIEFGGQTYPIDLHAVADFDWNIWRVGYEFDFVAADRGLIGIVTQLQMNQVSAQIGAAGFSTRVADVSAPIPTLGAILRVYPHRSFSISGEFTGLRIPGFLGNFFEDAVGRDEFDANAFDMDIYGTLNFGRHVGIQGGYRSVHVDYLADSDSGDLTMAGWYFGGLLRF